MNTANMRTDLATAVKWWRGQRGLSQEELAQRSKLHRTYISDLERAIRNPSLESLGKLARAMEISIPTLFAPRELASPPPPAAQGNDREWVDILLVEDSAEDVELTLQAFQRQRFANCIHVVRDGAEALDYIFRQGAHAERSKPGHPHVILLDLNLPKVSGLEVLRQLKAGKQTRSIPVIVLTSSRLNRDILESRQLGAETYIVKPVDFQNLSAVTPKLSLNWALLRSSEVKPRDVRV